MVRATLQIVQQKFLLFKISKVGNHLRIPIYQKKKKKLLKATLQIVQQKFLLFKISKILYHRHLLLYMLLVILTVKKLLEL